MEKLYKYLFVGTSPRTVMGQTVIMAGDIIEIPKKNYIHPLFKSQDGGKNFPVPISKLKNRWDGRKCLLIGRGGSSKTFDYKKYKKYIRIAVNIRVDLIDKVKPDYIIYLENVYSTYINRNIKKYKDINVIGCDRSLNCEKVDYYFNKDHVLEGSGVGFYALQIAEIMGFSEINLIGYDYYGDEYDNKTFSLWLSDFKRVEWKSKIINLNKKSKLMITGGK